MIITHFMSMSRNGFGQYLIVNRSNRNRKPHVFYIFY